MNGTSPIVSASIACADFGHLAGTIQELERAGVELFHFDIVDGRFSPTFITGPPVLASLRKYTRLPFEAHLACWNPEAFIEQFAEAGTDLFAFHLEAVEDVVKTAESIRIQGMKPVLALRPETPAEAVTETMIAAVSMLLVLTVNPGFAGQQFQPSVLDKISLLKEISDRANPECLIEADGNIHEGTTPEVVHRGARVLIGGTSGLFRAERTFEESVRLMKKAAEGS